MLLLIVLLHYASGGLDNTPQTFLTCGASVNTLGCTDSTDVIFITGAYWTRKRSSQLDCIQPSLDDVCARQYFRNFSSALEYCNDRHNCTVTADNNTLAAIYQKCSYTPVATADRMLLITYLCLSRNRPNIRLFDLCRTPSVSLNESTEYTYLLSPFFPNLYLNGITCSEDLYWWAPHLKVLVKVLYMILPTPVRNTSIQGDALKIDQRHFYATEELTESTSLLVLSNGLDPLQNTTIELKSSARPDAFVLSRGFLLEVHTVDVSRNNCTRRQLPRVPNGVIVSDDCDVQCTQASFACTKGFAFFDKQQTGSVVCTRDHWEARYGSLPLICASTTSCVSPSLSDGQYRSPDGVANFPVGSSVLIRCLPGFMFVSINDTTQQLTCIMTPYSRVPFWDDNPLPCKAMQECTDLPTMQGQRMDGAAPSKFYIGVVKSFNCPGQPVSVSFRCVATSGPYGRWELASNGSMECAAGGFAMSSNYLPRTEIPNFLIPIIVAATVALVLILVTIGALTIRCRKAKDDEEMPPVDPIEVKPTFKQAMTTANALERLRSGQTMSVDQTSGRSDKLRRFSTDSQPGDRVGPVGSERAESIGSFYSSGNARRPSNNKRRSSHKKPQLHSQHISKRSQPMNSSHQSEYSRQLPMSDGSHLRRNSDVTTMPNARRTDNAYNLFL